MSSKPVRANPGGEISPDEVFGRDALIRTLWRTLEQQSVVMVAERRIGKTSVVKKMKEQVAEETHLFYRDVESVRSPLEFAEVVAKDVLPHLPVKSKGTAKLKELFHHLAGVEIPMVVKFPAEIAQHWKALLQATMEDLLLNHPEKTYVFAWDELPIMIEKILHATDEATALDVLDTLRGLRQTHSNLRMIYTGSIGLHHVLSVLREAGHTNDATNDMRTLEVTELTAEDGQQLALALLAGESLRCAKPDETATAITSAVDNVPYFIHQVVARMRDLGDVANEQLALALVHEALVEPQDRWHLEHYRARLDERFGNERGSLARTILAAIAGSDSPLAFDRIATHLRSTIPRKKDGGALTKAIIGGEREPLRQLLMLLERDHYLRRNEHGHYGFRFGLIQRWWRLQES